MPWALGVYRGPPDVYRGPPEVYRGPPEVYRGPCMKITCSNQGIISTNIFQYKNKNKNIFVNWATVCKTLRPMLSDRCPVCNVRALLPNETWHAGRPRPWPHCVRWGPSSPPPKGTQPPIFGPYLLRPNGYMDQHATWYEGRPRPKRLCVR